MRAAGVRRWFEEPMRTTKYICTVALWVASALAAHRVARPVADYIVLCARYGAEAVSRSHLRIGHAGRTRLHVSNGDVLESGYAKSLGCIWGVGMLILTPTLACSAAYCAGRVLTWARQTRRGGRWDQRAGRDEKPARLDGSDFP